MIPTLPWFAARLLFQAVVSGDDSAPLYEERIVLVKAESGMDAARKKAQKLGEATGDEYQNELGQQVTWAFKEILDVVQLNESTVGDGAAVYHQFLTADEVERVRESLKPRRPLAS